MSKLIGSFPQIKLASEARKESPFLSVLLYGETGTGKTSWAARAPRPLVISFEHQGLASVSESNPDALVVAIESQSQYEMVAIALMKGVPTQIDGQSAYSVNLGGSDYIIQTIVIDSITQYTNQVKRTLEGDKNKKLQRDDWGDVRTSGQKMLELVTMLSTKCSVIVLATAELDTDENGRQIAIPITTPKTLVGDLGRHFALVGRAGRKQGSLATAHYITFAGQDRVAGKSFGKLPKTVWITGQEGRTTLGSMLLFLNGHDAPHNAGDSAEWVNAGPPTPEDLGVDTPKDVTTNVDSDSVSDNKGDW